MRPINRLVASWVLDYMVGEMFPNFKNAFAELRRASEA